MKNKKNSYSIRKLSVGASSIIVASMLFIGGGSVHAAESNHLENQEQSEVSASHSIEMQHKNQETQQTENKDNKTNHSETHLVLTLNLMKTNKLIVNSINLRHLCQIMINKTLKK